VKINEHRIQKRSNVDLLRQFGMEDFDNGRLESGEKKFYDDGLMTLTATMVGLAGSLAGTTPKEIPVQKEGLRKVLEELEKGNDVPISDVVHFVKELDTSELNSTDEEEVEEKIHHDIKHTLKLSPSKEYLSMNQTFEYLSGELHIDTEDEIMNAFTVFDKERAGIITLAEFNSIMEERGNPLNEEEVKMVSKCTHFFQVEEEDEQQIQGDDINGEQTTFISETEEMKPKKNRLRVQSKVKKVKKATKEYKFSKVSANEVMIRGPKDIKVNYRDFVKFIMGKINQQEKTLWGDQDK